METPPPLETIFVQWTKSQEHKSLGILNSTINESNSHLKEKKDKKYILNCLHVKIVPRGRCNDTSALQVVSNLKNDCGFFHTSFTECIIP